MKSRLPHLRNVVVGLFGEDGVPDGEWTHVVSWRLG
jgi:hypothetical protein